MQKYILAIDQGTTGTRAILYNLKAVREASAYQEFKQFFPKAGWVEHDPEEIWKTVLKTVQSVMKQKKISSRDIEAIGITNQRETTVLWNKKTGKPVARALVWQDRRTQDLCEALKRKKAEPLIRKKTGLVLDPYFSATKIQWLLQQVPQVNRDAKRGEILFGTMDTWLIWKMTGGEVHATDLTNASRTLLLNIHSRQWDKALLRIFKVPKQVLPQLKLSGADYGTTQSRFGFPSGIKISAVMGDQQSALYGQSCYLPGMVKNTYGTGCFAMMNLGRKCPAVLPHGLLTTLACDGDGNSVYAFEGAVFIAGAVMQWIRDQLKWFSKSSESEKIIRGLADTGGVTLIPAFSGLGSPYWNAEARGMISGITRGTQPRHIIRAALESIAHQSADVMEAMGRLGFPLKALAVDGGATQNNFLMQFQADLLGRPIKVSGDSELTAWGVAKLAGRISGFWKGRDSLALENRVRYRIFKPQIQSRSVRQLRERWRKEVARVMF